METLRQIDIDYSEDNVGDSLSELISDLSQLSRDGLIEAINRVKLALHEISPFKAEPVDCVLWVKNTEVHANDYNPNTVAPPEMELLHISIQEDGYTQPIVSMLEEDGTREVVDGFHRHRVGKEYEDVRARVSGYLPVVSINENRKDKSDRIASTIRHNRARGKHKINAMSDIVIELKNRNWSTERIARELGMDQDEILRLCQITGLENLFKDSDFSRSWQIDDSELEFEELTDGITDEEKERFEFRTVNTSDEGRIFHTYEKWECYKAGFYETVKPGMTKEQCEIEYAMFLRNSELFAQTLEKVIVEWKYSCEHYLTNNSMNRIAYLGQAALCYAKGIPSTFRGGFHILSEPEQLEANKVALAYLNKWLVANNRPEVTLEEGLMAEKQIDIY